MSMIVLVLCAALLVALGGISSAQTGGTTVSLNPAADTQINEAATTTNYGTITSLNVDGDTGSGKDMYDLLRFDLSSIPAGSTVTAAEFDVQVTNQSFQKYELYALNRSWSELSATWNSPWATAGAKATSDRGSTVLGYLDSRNVLGASQNALNASGVAAVQGWVNSPSTNYGMIIANTTNYDGIDFNSREGTTKPVLKVTYTPAGATVPAAPTALTATAASSSGINLSWTDNATNETNYAVERSADGTTFSTLTSSLGANTVSYSDTGLSPSTTYYYRVKATNATGSSSYSNTANATTQAAPATLYFSDGFERDADTVVPPWDTSCYGGAGGGITTDPTLARHGLYSGKFTVYDGDCTSFPTRANVRWSEHFNAGDNRYIGYSMYLPADFPASNPGWMNLGQFGFGPPWGYPPLQFSYWGDGTTQGMVVYDQNTVSLGNIPVTRGAWNDLVLHEYFSSNPSVGYLEVWKNGVPIVFNNGSTRVYTNTLRTDATGPGSFDLQQYRQGGVWPSPLSVWFDEAKVGSSYADVAP